MLNLISQQDDVDKIYLYAKDLNEPRYEFLNEKHEDAGTKHFNDLNAFIECSQTIWIMFMRILMTTTQTEK